MNLDFSDDQKMLRDQLRRFLEDRCPPAKVRAILEGPESFDRTLYTGLAEMGVLGCAIPEEFGGLGLGHLELCVLAEELGRVLAPVPVASSIYLVAEYVRLAGNDAQKSRWLPLLASGEAIGAQALTERTGRLTPDSVAVTARDGKLYGTKLPVADGDIADVAVVAARDSAGLSLYLVSLSENGVRREVIESVDPTRSQARVIFDGAPAELLGRAGAGWELIEQVQDQAAVLLSFEQIGGAERALEMARDYALERMAFGRQIGSFQAIKHMLADMYVSVALARSNGYYAAWALSTQAPELPVAAATARVSATQAFQQCAKNNIQVHGGMGFTWAFDCHLYYRRSNTLALMLGSQTMWEDRLIERMRRQDQRAA